MAVTLCEFLSVLSTSPAMRVIAEVRLASEASA